MRSRFAAYALGQVDHILDTTDPDGPQWQPDRAAWAHQVREFSRHTHFLGLRILEAPPPGDTEGFISFHADLEQGGMDVGFIERSRFTRCDGTWKYHSGEKLR